MIRRNSGTINKYEIESEENGNSLLNILLFKDVSSTHIHLINKRSAFCAQFSACV